MPNATPLQNADLDELLSRHGAKPSRWPAEARAPAEALLRNSASARALVAEAERLERGLDAMPTHPVPIGLRTRILANARPQDAWLRWLTTSLWRPASLACLPLLLGIALGANVAGDTGDLEDRVLVAFSAGAFADDALIDEAVPEDER